MGEEIAITFETLYDILMREKKREELMQLEPSFFQDIIVYLQEKMKIWEKISTDNDLFSLGERDKVEAEMKNTRKVLKDIYERREKKIIELALNKSRVGHGLDTDYLLDEEKKMFEHVVGVLDQYRHGVLMNLLNIKMPQVEAQKVVVELSNKDITHKQRPKMTMMVKFVHAVPKFVGSDLAIYGPFDEDDVASLPKDCAEILLEKKRAEIMEEAKEK